MRNLAEYPLTKEEIIEALRKAANDANTLDGIGGTQAACLMAAMEIVSASADIIEAINNRLDKAKAPLRYTVPWGEATKLAKALKGKA